MDFAARDAMLRAGLNLIPQAMSIYDDELRLVVCNRSFREMFRLPLSLTQPGASFEATIRHLAEVGDYADVEDYEAMIAERVAQAHAPQPHYMERLRPNGRLISVEGTPLPQGGWVTVYTDITDVKRQEELLRSRSEELSGQLLNHAEDLAAANRKLQATNAALEEARQELTQMEARIRLVNEMMPAHIAHIAADGTYTYSNLRLNSIMPGRPSNIVGLHMAEVLGTQAYAAVRPYVEAAYQGRSSVFEFTDAASSRRIRTALTPDGHDGAYILSTDVTEEAQTRAALQQSRRRQLAAQLTSGLAHDFSNLLTIILGAQSRLSRTGLPEESQALVNATLSAARRGGEMLNSLGEMVSERRPAPAPVEVGQFLTDLETLAAPVVGEGVRLDLRDRTGGARVMMDTAIVQDCLLNLILNAKDAVAGRGRITLSARNRSDTWLEFTAQDNGPGFSEAALEHAMDPFFTTKGDAGTGLGLPSVYDMSQTLGGQVKIANAPTGGAIVTLQLPWRPAPLAATPGLALLVEDSLDLRQNIRGMLREQGYSVIEATSVEEARDLIRQVPGLTLVLSDISLEGSLTGIDLFDSLPEGAPPCYMMTSLRNDHPLYAAAAQRAPVLRKPFGKVALAHLLRTGTLLA
ncbi:PAS-domain containing protein [Pseudooceanicola sp. C21-150M6]|uniref:PAS-domain containing protein n=1 Tax=Pseudooceanicola sp. C21-150M6 TaxID=3434355 RepID=UPI003D7F8AAE